MFEILVIVLLSLILIDPFNTRPAAKETYEDEDAGEFEVEYDIQGVSLHSIERRRGVTVFSYYNGKRCRSNCIPCTLEQHHRFVARFREKLGVPNPVAVQTESATITA